MASQKNRPPALQRFSGLRMYSGMSSPQKKHYALGGGIFT